MSTVNLRQPCLSSAVRSLIGTSHLSSYHILFSTPLPSRMPRVPRARLFSVVGRNRGIDGKGKASGHTRYERERERERERKKERERERE